MKNQVVFLIHSSTLFVMIMNVQRVIYSFNKYVLNTSYILDTIPGTEYLAVKEMGKIPALITF